MENYIVKDITELQKVAKSIAPLVKKEKIILFYGEMGAGKTSLIKALCLELGCQEEVTSPTYSIVNEYIGDENTIFHFDLFRLESLEEVLDIGIEEYVDSGEICLIEWPQKMESLISNALKIQLDKIDVNSRKISIFKF